MTRNETVNGTGEESVRIVMTTADMSSATVAKPFRANIQNLHLPSACLPEADAWLHLLDAAQGRDVEIRAELKDLFGPIIFAKARESLVIGQLGQSLDGRIATHSGHSKYINGEFGLLHLHRLRCLVDGVIVGVGTAIADDPQLTVRMCSGRHPARIVIDPTGRLPTRSRLLNADGSRCLVITGKQTLVDLPPHVEIIRLASVNGHVDPNAIIAALAMEGLHRILVEGGAQTISRFIKAGAIDRLHLLVAPIILGSGQSGLDLPLIDRVDEAIRPDTKAHLIGNEVVFDCDFSQMRKKKPAAIVESTIITG